MKLRELSNEANNDHRALLKSLEVTHDDYEKWKRNPLTRNVMLSFERLYYAQIFKKNSVDWVKNVEAVLFEEPDFVLPKGERLQRAVS